MVQSCKTMTIPIESFWALLILALFTREGLSTELITTDEDCDTIALPSVRQLNKCLTYNGTVEGWMNAQKVCQAKGGRLAVVDTAEKLEFATKFLKGWAPTDSRVMVGARNSGPNTDYTWEDGQATPLPQGSPLWKTGEGSTTKAKMVTVNPDTGELHDWDYNTGEKESVCEYVSATDELRLDCLERNGRQIGSSCFFVNDTFSTWEQCFDVLAAVGARPARIYTRDIARNLATLLPQWQEYWTGLRKWGATAHWMRDATTPDYAYDIRPTNAQFLVGDNNLCVKLKSVSANTKYPGNTAVACATSLRCLGEIVAPHQKFKKASYDQRLTPINTNGTLASLTLSWPDERACAGECQQHDGCLGFNFNRGSATCELLAFKTDGVPLGFGNWNAETGTSFHERHH